MGLDTVDYYAVLDVTPEASQEAIYLAYKKAQETYSVNNPELYNVFSRQEASDWMELIEEAFSIIGSPNSRREYDLEKKGIVQPSLPSFELQSTSQVPKASPPSSEPLPDGFAQTKISRYELKTSMEEMIEKQDVFDGLFLKKVREYKKIDLTDFSKATCIAIRHLYAIENNNFAVLPAAVFVRGYIIQYCRILGLDEGKVVPSFMSLLKNDN